jgi:ubiquitin-like protein Pup
VKQERAQKTTSRDDPEEIVELKSKDVEPLKGDLDSLLDEVDAVLEENAEEFVAQYVQKGGQHHAQRHTWFQPYGGACPRRSRAEAVARREP